jgi:hypothetical protein
MMRRATIDMDAVYDAEYRLAQDYELFTRLSRRTLLANIPEVLLHYRSWPGNSSRKPAQELAATQIVRRHAEALGVSITDDQVRALQGLARDRYPDAWDELATLAQLIMELRTATLRSVPAAPDRPAIDRDAAVRLWQLSIQAARSTPGLSLSLARQAFIMSPTSVVTVARKAARRFR